MAKPGRPKVYVNAERVGLVMPRSLRSRLRAYATGKNWSLSATIVDLLEFALAHKSKKKKP